MYTNELATHTRPRLRTSVTEPLGLATAMGRKTPMPSCTPTHTRAHTFLPAQRDYYMFAEENENESNELVLLARFSKQQQNKQTKITNCLQLN